jgi:hypothetical protein
LIAGPPYSLFDLDVLSQILRADIRRENVNRDARRWSPIFVDPTVRLSRNPLVL